MKKSDMLEKMDKKTMFLAVLSTTSLIIGADLATQLHHTQRALETAEQRIEVLEVQANDLYEASEKGAE